MDRAAGREAESTSHCGLPDTGVKELSFGEREVPSPGLDDVAPATGGPNPFSSMSNPALVGSWSGLQVLIYLVV